MNEAPSCRSIFLTALPWLALYGAGLIVLPSVVSAVGSVLPEQFASAFRSGALVFGGGHVFLPLLETDWVGERHWVSRDVFLAGYGAAQALPGPLFSFAAFLGAAAEVPGGIRGGIVAAAGIFLPGLLLVLAAFPVWARLRHRPSTRAALQGVNAAVVGILLAALIDPLWSSTTVVEGLTDPRRAAGVILCFAALALTRLPSWAVVLASAVVGAAAF